MVLIKNPFIIGVDYETATHMEGNLATEASMLVLDTLDLIVQIVSHTDHSQGLLASVLRYFVYIAVSTFCLHPPAAAGWWPTAGAPDWRLIVDQKIWKSPGQKKSPNQINQFHEIFLDQISFFAISKMAKNQFLNWEKN